MSPAYDRDEINPDYQYVSHAGLEAHKQLCSTTAQLSPNVPPSPPCPAGARPAAEKPHKL